MQNERADEQDPELYGEEKADAGIPAAIRFREKGDRKERTKEITP